MSHAPQARLLVLAAVIAAATACAAPVLDRWESPQGASHPLVGRVWDVTAGRFVGTDALVARLGQARYVLLGEKHDNPDHHRLQAWVVRAVLAAGHRPAVAFEMLTADQAPALERYLSGRPADARGLGEAVGWSRSGWPEWRHYQPIADAAVAAGLPVLPGGIAPATVREAARRGVAALDPGLVSRHRLEDQPPAAIRAGMAADIRDAHCGHAPEARVEPMVLIQRARDAAMADALVAGARQAPPGSVGGVLISGMGHARNDWGVPKYLPGSDRVASLAFLEVADDATAPEAYARRFGTPALPFDYVWFTPRLDDDDPCEKFKRSLDRMRQPSPPR